MTATASAPRVGGPALAERRCAKNASGGGARPGASAARPASTDAGRGARILVVEDEWFVAVANEAALREARYEVVGLAMSGEEALRLAAETRPDLVLMDIRLAGNRDGIETADLLRRRHGIASLFVTAHTDAAMRARGAAASRAAGWSSRSRRTSLSMPWRRR